MAFQRAIDVAKSQKGGSNSVFCFLKIKFNLNRIKPATKFICVKTSSAKVVVAIQVSNGP